MKAKYLAAGIAVLVVVAVLAALYLDPTYTLSGYLKGEPQYRSRPVSYWRDAMMREEDPALQAQAFKDLKDGGASAVPVLAALLKEKGSAGKDTAKLRSQAADLLGQIAPRTGEAIAPLIDALKDSDPHVRTVALRALSKYGPDAREAIPTLIELMKDKDSAVRRNAVRTLGKIGPEAKSAVPDLIAGMKDENAGFREQCAEALGDIGPEASEGVPALIEILKDPVARVRRDAVRSLGQIGPTAAKTALPAMKKLLQDEDADVRKYAEKAVKDLENLSK